VVDVTTHCTPLRVLDLAGGSGLLATRFSAQRHTQRVVLVDHDSDALSFAPDWLEKVNRDMTDIRDLGRFNAVILRQVLHYALDPGALLAGLRASLCEGGIVYIGQLTPPTKRAAEWLESIAALIPGNARIRALSTADYVRIPTDAGLRPLLLRAFPYRESVAKWLARASTSDTGAILETARSTLTPPIRSDLCVRGSDLLLTQQWSHGIWSFDPL